MALQTFTAGQVLTAAQVTALQTNGFNQSVSTKTADHTLVAADKGTRVEMNSASATTITVDTDLFNAGDTLFIQNIGAGVCTITAGTATVSTSGSLALVQNAGGTLFFVSAGVAIFYATGVTAAAAPSGLTLISTTTIGTAVSSVTVSGAFSATFDAYRIVITGGSASANINLNLQIGASATGYFSGAVKIELGGSVGNIQGANTSTFQTVGAGASNYLSFTVDVINPFLTKNTLISYDYRLLSPTTTFASGSGILNDTTSHTSFILSPASGTLTGGTIRVYGYQN